MDATGQRPERDGVTGDVATGVAAVPMVVTVLAAGKPFRETSKGWSPLAAGLLQEHLGLADQLGGAHSFRQAAGDQMPDLTDLLACFVK